MSQGVCCLLVSVTMASGVNDMNVYIVVATKHAPWLTYSVFLDKVSYLVYFGGHGSQKSGAIISKSSPWFVESGHQVYRL